MRVFRKLRSVALLCAALTGSATIGYVAWNGLSTSAAQAIEVKEHHSHIHTSIEELRAAKHDLEHADHDFGGHRAEAVRAIDAAIVQLEVAEKFERK